jgi:hypothetical protein
MSGILRKSKQSKRSEAGTKKFCVPRRKEVQDIKQLMPLPKHPPMSDRIQKHITLHSSLLMNILFKIMHTLLLVLLVCIFVKDKY